jgi:anthranilate synthase
LPPELSVTAETEDGVIMAVEHQHLPIAAVQFHPESVMTLRDEIGMPIIASVLAALPAPNSRDTRQWPSPPFRGEREGPASAGG